MLIHVLILNYEYPPLGGGAGNATYYLLKEYAKMLDLHVTLVTSSTSGFFVEKPSSNIEIYLLDIGKKGSYHYQSNKDLIKYTWKAWLFCRKYVKENRVDLVHAFFGIPCGFIALLLGKPYIVSLRGSDVPFYNKRFYWLDRLIFKNLSKVIWSKALKVVANSEGLKKLAQKSYPEQDISVIYNGVDTNEFCPPHSKKTLEKLRLISTGRLIERKGYAYLIDALKGLYDIQLILIGDGDQKEKLQDMALNNKIDVIFTGMVEHEKLSGYLQNADIFVMPSLNEGMSNSILEAMACGLPIITTDTGGAYELIHGNGLIVSKGDIDVLNKAVLKYIRNYSLIKKEGLISRRLSESFTWQKVANKHLDTYYKALARGEE